MPPPTTRTFWISPTVLALLDEELGAAEALLRLCGLRSTDRRPAFHHRLGHRDVLPDRRAALGGVPVAGLPVGLVVLPSARVDLDPEPARLAHVEVGDL